MELNVHDPSLSCELTASKNTWTPVTNSSTTFNSFVILHPSPFSRVCCYSDRAEDYFFFLTLVNSQRFSLSRSSLGVTLESITQTKFQEAGEGHMQRSRDDTSCVFLTVCVIPVHLGLHCLTQCMCCG